MDFFTYLLKSTAILSLFFLIDFFLLRKETLFKQNRYFLLAGIICALVFPFLEFTQITYRKTAPTPRIFNEIPIENHHSTEEESFNWIQLLFSIYVVGVAFMFLRFIIQLWGLVKILNLPKRKDTEGFYHIELVEKLSPFSFFKYIAYHVKSYDKSELDFIIQHEKIHGRQYHSIDVLLHQILLILFWFNPIVWFYQKRILENLEFIADSEVLKNDDIQQKNYELTLLKVATNYRAPTLANQFYQSFIKKRIVMLNKKQSQKYVFLKSMLILPLLGFFLWSFNVKKGVKHLPQDNSPTLNEINIEKSKIFKANNEAKATAINLSGIKVTSDDITEKSSQHPIIAKNTGKINASSTPNKNKEIAISVASANEPLPIYYINGEEATKEEVSALDPSSIKSIDVFKGEKAIEKYGEKGKNGVVEIKLKESNELSSATENKIEISKRDNTQDLLDKENILILLNGERITKEEIQAIDSTTIKSVDVIKNKKSIKKYGKEGKNGVIVIITK